MAARKVRKGVPRSAPPQETPIPRPPRRPKPGTGGHVIHPDNVAGELFDAAEAFYMVGPKTPATLIALAVATAIVEGETFEGSDTRRLREWMRKFFRGRHRIGNAIVFPVVDRSAGLRIIHDALESTPEMDSAVILANLAALRIHNGPIDLAKARITLDSYRQRSRSLDPELVLVRALRLVGWSDVEARRAVRKALDARVHPILGQE